jgi:transcriptional regulator with XRE-family HTH domain
MNKDELKQYRERIGLTQGELSKALGVANNTVSRWELGQRSIPEFLPLALETIERRLSTVGSDSVSTVGSIDDKSTVGSSESSKAQSAPKQTPMNGFEIVREKKKRLGLREKDAKLLAKQLSEGNSGKPFNYSILEIVQSSSDNEYVLTTAAAGELLNLSPRSVRENAEKGLLPGKQGKQSHWFFRRSDIDGFISRRG